MRTYFGEFNRVIDDNIRRAMRVLQSWGLNVQLLPHKTALRIERPEDMSWADFKRAIRGVLQPRRGSVMISSETSGRTYVCSNRGNQPGAFQRQ
ncbi:hypothetical protein [Bradyrhizobium cosmicum]|uniref:hypothetical protein n=1 Tax=Bradyrhizobium cosmicum TaxID=1404864 RepID=UPI0028EF0701|nr:hypothetical protein [Bradyrhizobium cosmicum]